MSLSSLRIHSKTAQCLASLSTSFNSPASVTTDRRCLQPPLRDVTDAALRSEAIMRYKISIGNSRHEKCDQFVVLFAGATGSGKSATINSALNFLYEVDFNDDIRFVLPQREANAGESVTRDVLVYELHDTRYEGAVITIVDTPGFADTQGPDQDRLALRRISEFLSFEKNCGSGHINAVCFTIDAHDCRYTTHTAYVYDQVCMLFTKTMQNNIFVVFTKDDGSEIKALAVLERHKFTIKNNISLNNSGFFHEIEKRPQIQQAKFNDACKKFANFFHNLFLVPPYDLSDLVTKLNAQEELNNDSEQLFRRIIFETENYEALLRNIKKLNSIDERQHLTEFRIQTPAKNTQRQIVNHEGKMNRSLICNQCQSTCHFECNHLLWQWTCPAIGRTKSCKVCSCPIDRHEQANYFYEESQLPPDEEETVKASPDDKEDLTRKTLKRIIDKLRRSERTRRDFEARIVANQQKIAALQLYESIYNKDTDLVDQLIEREMRVKQDGYKRNVAEYSRHRALMDLVRKTVNDDSYDPIEEFVDDLNGIVEWLARRMPEIADWIRGKLKGEIARKLSKSSITTEDSGYKADTLSPGTESENADFDNEKSPVASPAMTNIAMKTPQSVQTPSCESVSNVAGDVKDLARFARVTHSYPAAHDDELTLPIGAIIAVVEKECGEKGWCLGELDGRRGLFPNNFVQFFDDETKLAPTTTVDILPRPSTFALPSSVAVNRQLAPMEDLPVQLQSWRRCKGKVGFAEARAKISANLQISPPAPKLGNLPVRSSTSTSPADIKESQEAPTTLAKQRTLRVSPLSATDPNVNQGRKDRAESTPQPNEHVLLREQIEIHEKRLTEVDRLNQANAILRKEIDQLKSMLKDARDKIATLEGERHRQQEAGATSQLFIGEQHLMSELKETEKIVKSQLRQIQEAERRVDEEKNRADTNQALISVLRKENQEIDRRHAASASKAEDRIKQLEDDLCRLGKEAETRISQLTQELARSKEKAERRITQMLTEALARYGEAKEEPDESNAATPK